MCEKMTGNDGGVGAVLVGSGAPALRCAAGAPAVVRRDPRRRGSFLVIVVGTLALLAVVTIVYVALGNQDARTKAAVVKRDQLDLAPQQFARYVQSVIGDDALALTHDRANVGLTGAVTTFRREVTDAPGVLYSARTDRGGLANGEHAFNPAGDVPEEFFDDTDPLQVPAISASDPYLSAPEPAALTTAWNTGAPSSDPTRPYLDNRDWPFISNLAPDGAFVNLVNLRNNFDATPDELRAGKTLLTVTGATTTQLDTGAAADRDVPAHWTNRQVSAFRPATPPVTELPGSAEYRLNQWVDADGDGFLDSRIFQAVDAGDMAEQRWIVPDTRKYRWFFGARAIDLSGNINVNFATDQVAPPKVDGSDAPELPIGLTPADIDVRRVLAMIDGHAFASPDGASPQPGGYQRFADPNDPNDPLFVYDEAQSWITGVNSYAALRLAVARGVVPGGYDSEGADYTEPGGLTTFADVDYMVPPESWKFSEWRPGAPPMTFGGDPWVYAPARRASFFAKQARKGFEAYYEVDPAAVTPVPAQYRSGGLFGPGDLGELLTRWSMNDPETTSPLEQAVGPRDSAVAAGLLLDPLRSTRTLGQERIAYEDSAAVIPPVNSPRDRALARVDADIRRLLTTNSGARSLRVSDEVRTLNLATPVLTDYRFGRIDPYELSPDELKINAAAALDPGEARQIVPAPNGSNVVRSETAYRLFRGYAQGLAGASSLADAWDATNPNVSAPLATLFYGYQGPQMALMTAGAMSVNMADLADHERAGTNFTSIPEQPTVRTLLLADPARTFITDDVFNATSGGTATNDASAFNFGCYWWQVETQDANGIVIPPRNLDLSDERSQVTGYNAATDSKLARDTTQTISPVLNMYGVEPQAFITQVSTFAVYSNDPASGTSDPGDPVEFRHDVPDTGQPENPELIYRMVAFKLTNPFGEDVALGGNIFGDADPNAAVSPPYERGMNMDVRSLLDRADSTRDFSYIRWGDKTYLLTALRPRPLVQTDAERDAIRGGNEPSHSAESSPLPGREAGDFALDASANAVYCFEQIVVPAGKSVVVYAMSVSPARFNDRAVALALNPGNADPFVVDLYSYGVNTTRLMLETQIGLSDGDLSTTIDDDDVADVYWVPMLETTDPAVTPTIASNIQDIDGYTDVLPRDTSGDFDEPKAVTLWRALRAPSLNESMQDVAVNSPIGLEWDGLTRSPSPGEGVPPTVVFRPNDYTNDLLLDRFHLPANMEMNVRLKDDTEGVVNSSVQDDTPGLTGMMWATAKRPVASDNTSTPGGVFPAYCIEPKPIEGSAAWNIVATGGMAPTLDFDQFDDLPSSGSLGNSMPSAGLTMGEWFSWMANAPGQDGRIDSHIHAHPANYATPAANEAAETRTGFASAMTHPAVTADTGLAAVPYSYYYPQFVFQSGGNKDFRHSTPLSGAANAVAEEFSTLRLGDLMLPMGVCAIEAPLDNAMGVRPTIEDVTTPNYAAEMLYRYTTLGEAMAASLGFYESAVAGSPQATLAVQSDPSLLWHPISLEIDTPKVGAVTVGGVYTDPTDVLLFDRGNLWLDRFVPFVDNTPSPSPLPPQFDRTADRWFGPAIPSALVALDQFRATTNREALDVATPGLVNINTAPVAVLRALPMATPPAEEDVNGLPRRAFDASTGDADPAWRRPEANGGAPFPWTMVNDFGASIAAYRDMRTVVSTPYQSLSTIVGLNSGVPQPLVEEGVPFYETAPTDSDRNFFSIGDPSAPNGWREAQTGIMGLSSQTGFQSPAELLAVRIRSTPFGQPIDPAAMPATLRHRDRNRELPFNVDALGYDQDASGAESNSSHRYLDSIRAGEDRHNMPTEPGVANEYDEKLLVANAMLNTVTTRSDVFAVWFVIMGFQESDVMNLPDDETPMVPSIRRRFLMVLDRSNVYRRGEEPRVLLFKEVPID
ncbi:MAG TPA: hypothetical protein VD971_00095 [Phycisphaerales bacterium]|nr:hypothetical protein [Phycisphaerales bacterium]